MGGLELSFVAGVVSVLSPCVLPILPLVLGAAAAGHRMAPAVLAVGLSASFVATGLFAATVGYSIGLDGDALRKVTAVLIIGVGAVLLMPRSEALLAVASGPLANWTDQRLGKMRKSRLLGWFGVGLLLGIVWSPCVGPTLGAASILAAQGRDLPQVGVTMLAFGLGAGLPLLALGFASREAVMRWRRRLLSTGRGMKLALGFMLMLVGVLVVSGLDKAVETVLVDSSPQWLTELTTRF